MTLHVGADIAALLLVCLLMFGLLSAAVGAGLDEYHHHRKQ